jgi:hypothetical protein
MADVDAHFERIRECEGWHAACTIMVDENAMTHVLRALHIETDAWHQERGNTRKHVESRITQTGKRKTREIRRNCLDLRVWTLIIVLDVGDAGDAGV